MVYFEKGRDRLNLQVNNFTFGKVENFKCQGVNINMT